MHACIDDDWILVFDLYLRVNYHRRRTCTFVEKKNEMEIWEEHEMKIICRRMSTKIWVDTKTTLK